MSVNNSNFDGYDFPPISGAGYVDFQLDKMPFNPSNYVCNIAFSEKEFTNYLDFHEKCYSFNVTGGFATQGLTNPFPKWSLKQDWKLI